MTTTQRPQQILVTGGTGYLGARLCRFLAEAGHLVTALGRSAPESGPRWEDWRSRLQTVILGDLSQPELARKTLSTPFDCVIWSAAMGYQAQCSLSERLQKDLLPLATWVETYAARCDASDKNGRFLFFSTERVLGSTAPRSTPNPENPNALAHYLGENLITYQNQKSNRTRCLSLRLANVYGSPEFRENKCWSYLINELCQQAVRHKKITLKSDGTALRDFIHMNDFTQAVHAWVERPHNELTSIRTPIPLGSGVTHSVAEAAHAVAQVYSEIFDQPVSVEIDGRPAASPTSMTRNAHTKLKNGIRETLEHLK